MTRYLLLNEHTQFGYETGAGLMRNRCAFTSKDMAAEFDSAFTYAIVWGWDADEAAEDAMAEVAAHWGWDTELVAFLREAHQMFQQLSDKRVPDRHGEEVPE